MEQMNLWMSHARCTGFAVAYESRLHAVGLVGKLAIVPQWSKQPRKMGAVLVELDEETEQYVPDLVREAYLGYCTTDPGHFIPRRIQAYLQDQEGTGRCELEY